MKLTEVLIVELLNDDIVLRPDENGNREQTVVTQVRKVYDFGPDNKGHEQHVMFGIEEFTCYPHDEYHADCEGCNLAVFGRHDGDPEIDGVADHLRKSRGIVIEP